MADPTTDAVNAQGTATIAKIDNLQHLTDSVGTATNNNLAFLNTLTLTLLGVQILLICVCFLGYFKLSKLSDDFAKASGTGTPRPPI